MPESAFGKVVLTEDQIAEYARIQENGVPEETPEEETERKERQEESQQAHEEMLDWLYGGEPDFSGEEE